MATLARRDPFSIDWPAWFGRQFEDWLPEVKFETLGKGGVRVEEFSEDGTLVVRAELPGIDPDTDVEISVHDGVLHIKGERTEHQEETKKAYYRSEFRYGMFERTVPLPAGATEKDVKATYKDGVLEVRIPMKTAETAAAKVPVQRLG
jgi:HSP20 family protein